MTDKETEDPIEDEVPFIGPLPHLEPAEAIALKSKVMKTTEDKETKLSDEEIEDIKRGVFERLAGRLEYAVDNNMEIRNLTDAELEEADNIMQKKKAAQTLARRRLTSPRLQKGIPRGTPRAVKVWSLTKEGREFLERLWDTFGELKEEMEERVTPRITGLLPDSPMRDTPLVKLKFWSFISRATDGWIQDIFGLHKFFEWLEGVHPEVLEVYKEDLKELFK